MGPGARGVSARRLGLSVDRRSGLVSVGRGSRGRGVPGDEGRDVSAAARESVPLDDVGGAVRDAGIVGVGARGDAVRTLHAADAQFVADAPLHVELARAGAAHRAPAHGQVGDHGHATRVRVHRARARVGRVLGSMWRTRRARRDSKSGRTGRSRRATAGRKIVYTRCAPRGSGASRLVSPTTLVAARGRARGRRRRPKRTRARPYEYARRVPARRPRRPSRPTQPPRPRDPPVPGARLFRSSPPSPRRRRRVAYRLPSFTMGHPRRRRWNL